MVAIRMRHHRHVPTPLVLALALVAACDTIATKEAPPATASVAPAPAKDAKPAAKPAPAPEPTPVDWAKQAVKPTSVEVDGQKFQVSVPDGLKLEIKKGDGTFPGYANWTSNASFDDPSFTVQAVEFPPRDLDDAARKLETGKYKTTVKEAVDGGFLVAVMEDSKEYLHVELVKKGKTDKWYRFSIMQRTSKPMTNLDATQAWMLATVKTFVIE